MQAANRLPDPNPDSPKTPVFLTADWRHLVMLNYEVDADVLLPFLPAGLELDTWQGKTLCSLVGFEFLNTRVLGLRVPGHEHFHEVNLRFYVRRKVAGGWRRGVVFVRELVPNRAIAWAARRLYGERYRAVPMNGAVWHRWGYGDNPDRITFINYWWRTAGSWEGLYAEARGEPGPVAAGSQAWFITDHAWGYSTRRGKTLEYEVEHPPWWVWQTSEVKLDCDVGRLYSKRFGECMREPCSAFVAEGSPIVVRKGRRLTT